MMLGLSDALQALETHIEALAVSVPVAEMHQ